MYNISIIIKQSGHTPIYINKEDSINHNFVTARFIEGENKDIVGLYISHQLGNLELDNLVREIGYGVLDPIVIPNINQDNIRAMETTHIFYWGKEGFLKRVSIENGIIHYHRDREIISEYPITTGAKIECLQSLRGITNYNVGCHIGITTDKDEDARDKF